MLSLALADDAFEHRFTSVADILQLQIPPGKESLRVPFKQDVLQRPIFRDVQNSVGGSHISPTKALPYAKLRAYFVWLGRLAGFEQLLELYQLRRASGRKLNSTWISLPITIGVEANSDIKQAALTPEERNQTMGHHGDTYQQFYMSDLLERDFQSIYFGTPSHEALIQHAARMGTSRDACAPTDLTNEQKIAFGAELPEVSELRRQREECVQELKCQGYQPLAAARGHPLYERYCSADKAMRSLKTVLRRRRVEQAIREFHRDVHAKDISTQLGAEGGDNAGVVCRPTVQFEFNERAALAEMLPRPLHMLADATADQVRKQFIRSLTLYCSRQESRQDELCTESRLRAKRSATFECDTEHFRENKKIKSEADEEAITAEGPD